MQPRQVKRILSALKKCCGRGPKAFGMTAEYLGGRNRHRRVQEHRRRGGEPPAADALAQKIKQLVGALERECGNDDIAAAFEGVGNGFKKLGTMVVRCW
jgi:hypothetical protein